MIGCRLDDAVDESGFWESHVRTGPGHEIYDSTSWKAAATYYWVRAWGGIGDFECWGGAALYAAEDGYMYYSPAQGWFDQDEEAGVLTIPVFGPYEIRALGARNLLDPNPTVGYPQIWIPSHVPFSSLNERCLLLVSLEFLEFSTPPPAP